MEELNGIRNDAGFRSLIRMEKMPGPDAVWNWLRRMGAGSGLRWVKQMNADLVRRYLRFSKQKAFVFDVDGTLIESNKGDATYSYKHIRGYHLEIPEVSDSDSGEV